MTLGSQTVVNDLRSFAPLRLWLLEVMYSSQWSILIPVLTDYLSLSRWAFLLRQIAPAVNIPDLILTVMRTSTRSSTVSAGTPPSALSTVSTPVVLVRCLRLAVHSPQTQWAGLLVPSLYCSRVAHFSMVDSKPMNFPCCTW